MVLGTSITIGIILVATLTFFFKDQITEQNIETAKDVLVSVENELFLASKVEPGYSRNFETPLNLNNEDYNISISNGELIIFYHDIEFIGSVPELTGDVQKGENTVKNVDGKICLNLEVC